MNSSHVVYEFGGFCLDPHERVLRRDSLPVPLTPKATEILLALVARRGHIVEKADLMRQVWPDTAVDESNLTQNIYTLRRILGNGDGNGLFIETVPRRGYRFVATVRERPAKPTDVIVPAPQFDAASTMESPQDDHVHAAAPALPAAGRSRATRTRWWLDSLAAVVRGGGGPTWIAVAITAGSVALAMNAVKGGWLRPTTNATNPGIERLTNEGSVRIAALSPDSRDMAYVRSEGVRQSLWLKRSGDANATRVLEPIDGTFRSLTFDATGDFLRYSIFQPNKTLVASWRIATSGGSPETMREPAGRISFSPDGSRFASISTYSLTLRESRIVVSDVAGRDVHVITVRRPPESFVYTKPAWSPDGSRLVVFGVSELSPASPELLVIDVATGRPVKSSRLNLVVVDGAVWLPDGHGVIVSGRERRGTPQRLWLFSLSSAALRPLTNDLSDYELVGSSTSQNIVAVRGEVARSLWNAKLTASGRAHQVAQNSGDLGDLDGLAWSSNDRILYTAAESGNVDIWSANVNDDNRSRLTSDPADDFHPSSTADGRTVVFASTREGSPGIWTMDGDGDHQKRLTTGADVRPSISREGRVLVFQRGAVDTTPFTLWRLLIGENRPAQIAEHHSMRPALSPDGRSVAHYLMTAEAWMLAITPTAGGPPARTLPISVSHGARVVRWSPDGRAVAFIDGTGGASNIWVQPLDGSPARKLTSFSEGRITTFDWSPDGSRLAWTRINEVRDVVTVKVDDRRRSQ